MQRCWSTVDSAADVVSYICQTVGIGLAEQLYFTADWGLKSHK